MSDRVVTIQKNSQDFSVFVAGELAGYLLPNGYAGYPGRPGYRVWNSDLLGWGRDAERAIAREACKIAGLAGEPVVSYGNPD